MGEEHLRRLYRITPFLRLHEKLEDWLDEYNFNTCDQNVAQCCDIIELNARIQRELFKLLNKSAAEGGLYGGASTIKSRFLPWLGQDQLGSGKSICTREQDADLEESRLSLQFLEDELKAVQKENVLLKDQLELKSDLKSIEYNVPKRSQSPAKNMMKRYRSVDDLQRVNEKESLINTYEKQIAKLRKDVYDLSDMDIYNWYPRSSRATMDELQQLRQDQYVRRFKEMYFTERREAMNTMRLYGNDKIRNERILFAVFRKAFAAGRFALHQYKMKLRETFDEKYDGTENVDDVVQDFLNKNCGPFDLTSMVSDVIHEVDTTLSHLLPSGTSISIIRPYIREACKLGWNMSLLVIPLDIDLGAKTVFDPIKYRRSGDSDFTSKIVSHYVWPCIYLGASLSDSRKVLAQGEAVTCSSSDQRRYRSRSPSHSRSPSWR